MAPVPGLDKAISLYSGSKVTDRNQGGQLLRDIFSNRDYVEVFDETASQEGGAGWVALFQVLFPVVLMEKTAAIHQQKKKAAAPPTGKQGSVAAEGRVVKAISLVRWFAERFGPLLSRRPFMTLFTHMTTLLVDQGGINESIGFSYAKGLRSLLSFPPHLENLDPRGWRTLMGVCWAALLGDPVSLDGDEMWESDQMGNETASRQSTISTPILTELLNIVPILLSSTRAQLIAEPRRMDDASMRLPSLGLMIIFKISRYLKQLPAHSSVPIEMLRSLNLVLTELELNSKDEFTTASLKIFPQIVAVWTSRSKGDLSIRESALVALRMMLLYVTHPSVTDVTSKMTTREAMGRIVDWLGKEAGARGAIRPMDLNALRFDSSSVIKSTEQGPFQMAGVMAGFGFDSSQALNWAAVELYADCLHQTFDAPSPPSPSPAEHEFPRKRQRIESGMDKLLTAVSSGPLQTRQLVCQVVVFLIAKHWSSLASDARAKVRSKLVELLDDDDPVIQSWTFIGLSCLAIVDDNMTGDNYHRAVTMTPATLGSRRRQEQPLWEKVWTYAVRKTSVKDVSRAACHAANVVLKMRRVDHTRCVRDIHSLLRNVDIQGLGPAATSDSALAFLTACIETVRADAGLYSANLEDKVLDWFARALGGESTTQRYRMSSATSSNNLNLLSAICHFSSCGIEDVSVTEHLPDCPIVNRILYETETAPIRNVILHGVFPTVPSSDRVSPQVSVEAQNETTVETLGMLEGRPRKLSNILRGFLENALEEWSPEERSTLMTTERLRKAIDLVVLTLTFQATIQANGLRPDVAGCLQPAASLIHCLASHLARFADSIPQQQLVWRGWMPLYYRVTAAAERWPILLKPDAASGIRHDILPEERYATHHDEDEEPGNSPRDKLLAIVWRGEEVRDALSMVVDTSKQVLQTICAPSNGEGEVLNTMDDDDFGPILIADADVMTQSSEAREAHRSAESLVRTLVDIRLRGPLLASSDYRSVKDTKLLNSFLSAEGSRFIQLGFALCNAIQDQSLRLTLNAVDYILGELSRRLSRYVFKRDGELIRLSLVFLASSITVWLSPESGLTDMAIELAQGLVDMAQAGRLSYWPARLQLLLFIDDYLEYDPTYSAWAQHSDSEEVDVAMGNNTMWGPLRYVLDSTGDIDSRVRFRGLSSAAAVHYLTDLPGDQKSKAYFETLAQQSQFEYRWDNYLTNLVWKLNTCIASSQLRSATMFHLYEVISFQSNFATYLQPGLEAVAQRLGLDSLKPLFLAHAGLIVSNLLNNDQSPLNLPPALYGCSSSNEFAQLCVEMVGPQMLASHDEEGHLTFFSDACHAALIPEDLARERYLPQAAAIAVVNALKLLPQQATYAMITDAGVGALGDLPQSRDGIPIENLLTERIEFIVSSLIGLTDLGHSNKNIAQVLNTMSEKGAGDIFMQLLANEIDTDDTPAVLSPDAPDVVVLQAQGFLRQQFPEMSRRRMVFDGVVRLFAAVNDTYLVTEQRRYLRAIALLVSLFSIEFSYGVILQQFLGNVVEILTQDNVASVAISMLEWGFDQVPKCTKQEPDLVDVLIKLGSVYTKLQANEHLQPVAERLGEWIASKAQSWMRLPAVEEALNSALAFWPPVWTDNFSRGLEYHFHNVANIARRPKLQNPMALCRRLDKTMRIDDPEQKELFLSSTFWYLKKALRASEFDSEGVLAFMDLLYKSSGEVHAPSLTTIKGMTGRSRLAEYAAHYERTPEIGLRMMVMAQLVQQCSSDDYRLRTTTFNVLQSTLPILKGIMEGKETAVPQEVRGLIVYLISNTSVFPVTKVDLNVLTMDVSGTAWVHKTRAHRVWAKDLALMLGALAAQDDAFYACLEPLLSSASNAAIELLPYLVQAVLTCGAKEHNEETVARAAILTSHFSEVLQFPFAATETLETIINIILHLRHFPPPYGKERELAYNHWLSIDALILSEAAGKCGAYASSLLFLEMKNDRDNLGENEDPKKVEKNFDLSAPRIQKDPDGFYGIHNNDVMDSLLRRLDHEVQPVKSLGYNLASYESMSIGASESLVSSLRNLHDLGFHSFAGTFMKNKRREGATDASSDPLFFELAWRMGDWDVPITQDLADTSPGRFYTALRAVHRERDREVARRIVDDTIQKEMSCLKEIGVERMTDIKAATINLLCLRDISKWVSPPMQAAIDQCDFEGHLLSSFVDLNPSFDFSHAERLSATRLSLIRSARERESKNTIGDLVSGQFEGLANLEVSSQLCLSELARKEGNLQAAVNAVTAVRQLEEGCQPSDMAQDEFSQVLWAQGHHSLAIQHVTAITDKLKPGRRRAILLGRSAHWTALAKLKAAEEIRRTFRESMALADAQGSEREKARVAYDFALWTDSYYEILSRSPELERLKSFVLRKSDRSHPGSASPQATPPGSPHAQAELELEEDRNAKRKMESELLRYLGYTLQSYAIALACCDDYDDSITRLCSLWLAHDTNEDANIGFAPHLQDISSHKFIVLAPQLAARLFRPIKQTTFNATLNNLMLRLSEEHPYHVLYQIITLAAGATRPLASSRSRAATPSASLEGRSGAAAEIMERLRTDKDHPIAAEASVGMGFFAEAAVKWAQQCHDRKESMKPGREMSLPASCPLNNCRKLKIPIATVVPPIDLTMKYAGVPIIERYRSTFRAAGGIHRPAIMTVVDSLGHEHVQLFKAEDEVRQDAVMEQVFDMTNRLLRRDRKTSIRNLTFRTYTVVPLQNKTGIIEFVGSTTAIGDWLKEAHLRYRKGVDITGDVVRKQLSHVQERHPGSDKLVATYNSMMSKFKPVMRHFFTEKRREPLAWFSMRLNYARSVAVTSMVGYMVGLGDRHCSNILIDKNTGELVHIDFGIVFEEGRKLRIPEKVPFRLTNDTVDGLGITGVDGTFRQCAEHTLRVLRDSSDLIMTVLEVFKHDPLYAWTGDPSKMRRAQGGATGRFDLTSAAQAQAHGQDKAERVLTRIRQKLGRELSVEYTVNMLIQEARDPSHLAKIYVGWQPWM